MTKYFLFVFFLLFGSALAVERIFTRAYFIGFHDDYHVSCLLNPKGGNLMPEKLEAPFENALFRDGDELLRVPVSSELSVLIEGDLEHLVYNRTTGRLVVQGGAMAHRYLKTYALRIADDLPRVLQANLRIYQVVLPDSLKVELNEKLMTGKKPVAEIVLMGRPSQITTSRTRAAKLKISWEPNITARDDYIDARIEMAGEIEGQSFSIKTGFTSFDSKPVMMELGKFGEGPESFVLSVKQEIIFSGEASRMNLILDGKGNAMPIPLRTSKPPPLATSVIDPKTGKGFVRYQVPPTFIHFIKSAEEAGGDADPFAVDESEDSKIYKDLRFLEKWDHRITALPSDRVVDILPLMRVHNKFLQADDQALLNLDSDTVYVESNLKGIRSAEDVFFSYTWDPPTQAMGSFALLESEEEITAKNLQRKGMRYLARGSFMGSFGTEMTVKMGKEERRMECQLEVGVGAGDRVFDVRNSFSLEGKYGLEFQSKSGLTLIAEKPMILQSHREGGKWRALVMTVKREVLE